MKSAFCWPYVSSDHPAAVGHHRCTWIEEDSGITGHCGHWTPLWRTLTSPQCHKSRQIPDSEPQPLRDAVERPDALLKRRPDLRLSADPGSRGRHPEDGHHDTFSPVRMREHAVWSAERRENIPTFYVRSDERVAILLRLLTRRAAATLLAPLERFPSSNGTYKKLLLPEDAIETFEEMKEAPVNVILLSWRGFIVGGVVLQQ
ncbi:hypothetical protein T11_8853 [Trichinella zimbabwensis]|uniref:Uncharacterized protein n=1 Tax=Trichinella zimbabwensis TaxID=268475 RepID=A0A0V1GUC0_9BILA|nr:hypothetical protein T11_8853 [Trichinella zimbabwensis]